MSILNQLIIFSLSSFILATLFYPLFIRLLKWRNLFDQRDQHKIHDRDVPSLGGVVSVLSGYLSLFFFFPIDVIGEFKYLFASLFVLMVVGLRDDLLPLKPFIKLLSQLIPCIIVFYAFDTRLDSLYSIWPVDIPEIPALLLTAFTLIIITNSLNLIDGIDGLAGSLSIISLSAFATELFLMGNHHISLVIASFVGAQIAFIFFNWPPAKIFMGDTGALFYGFLLGVTAILFINMNHSSDNPAFQSSVGTAMAILGIPLFDTFRIIFLRIKMGQSPTRADQNHIHHLLIKLGMSHGHITTAFIMIQLLVISLAHLFSNLNDFWVLAMLAIVYFGLLLLIIQLLKAKAKKSGI